MAAPTDDGNPGSRNCGAFTDENTWKTGRAHRFGWLIDGEEYFAALRTSLEAAEREILIVGWDIDSTVSLVRDQDHPHYPSPLAETLETLAESNKELRIHVLSWDFALVYMLERELLPAYRFGWEDSERLNFHLDNRHAVGASHHQKFVVIDGMLAYIGGFDLTKSRWDTRTHAPDDPRRRNSDGSDYRPFHDVQAVVAGEPARRLRELAEMRWQNATGCSLPGLDDDAQMGPDTCWPDGVTVRGEDVQYALARTWASPDSGDTVKEVERLFLDMIAAARRSIYIENQYFTAPAIADALAGRLAEDDGPEIVIVLPAQTSGWLEQATMEMRRNRLLHELMENDRHGRLLVAAPVSDDLGDQPINVHGKVMIVDDNWVRIGSANLSCRSLGLDSECDIVFHDTDGSIAADLRADLVAEHVGAEVCEIATAIREDGLVTTLAEHKHGRRRLEQLSVDRGDYETLLEPIAKIADMEKPLDNLWQSRANGDDQDSVESGAGAGFNIFNARLGWAFLAVLLVASAVWALWSAQDLDPRALLESLRQTATHPLAPLIAVPAFVAGSIVVAPVTGMIALCALLFSPWVGSLTAIAGTLIATAVNFAIGARLGQVIEARAPKSVVQRIRSISSNADAWSLAGLRLIPIAPFTIINLLAGAAGVRLSRFLLGTLLGMGPGVVLICLSVDRARAALSGEPVFDPWIIGAIAAAGVTLIAIRLWQQRQDK
jgi:phosphatidylserine/phosphatidylglycerophosphate/cardiolipin synthase-like enzyme/uncharacterized membrane protein YdjX (TVP38/TMEM64 family)